MSKDMTDRRKWIRIIDSLPPENQEVETKIDDHMGVRSEYIMTRVGKCYYYETSEIPADYTPTHWRTIQNKEV